MLKKKNIFVVIFSFILCSVMNFGFASLNAEKDRLSSSVFAVSSVPTFEGFPEGDYEGGTWEYDGIGELVLNGATWESMLSVPTDVNITMTGENSVTVASGFALVIESGGSLNISGSGVLVLDTAESSNVVSCGANAITLGDGIKVIDAEGNEVSLSEITEKKDKLTFYSENVQPVEHIHNFTYSANGAMLIATCGEQNCNLTDSKAVAELKVSDVVIGGMVDYEFDLTEFNIKTGLTLSDSDFGIKYYKDGNDTAYELNESTTEVGGHYLIVSSNENSVIGACEVKCDFEVTKIPTTILSNNEFITYDGKTYDLSQMFEFCENAGDVTYSMVDEESTALGEINGSILTINKCGILTIKVTTTGTGNYAGSETTAILTIEKANLVAGTEDGQVYISIGYGVDDGILYEGGENQNNIKINNNHGEGQVTWTYWLNAECSIPTTAEHGATEQNGLPTLKGKYYVKSEIAETDFYKSVSVNRSFILKGPIDVDFNNDYIEIDYTDLIDGKIDLRKLLIFKDGLEEHVKTIEYCYVEQEDVVFLKSQYYEILSIIDAENGDKYTFRILIGTKEDSIYSGLGMEVSITVKKIAADLSSIEITDKTFDGNPVVPSFNDFTNLTITYFLDSECETAVTENAGVPKNAGKYFAKVTIPEMDYTLKTERVIEFNITPKEVEINWDENDFTYNSQVQEIQAYYVDILGEQVYLGVTTDKEFKNVQVDGVDYTYTATASFVNAEINYKLPNDITEEYQIKPMKLEIQVRDRNSRYGSAPNELILTFLNGGKYFEGDPIPYRIRTEIEITKTTPVGKYKILTESTGNTNYDVEFVNEAYYHVKNWIKTNDMIESWVYGKTPDEPEAEDVAGKTIKFLYYDKNKQEYLDSKPTLPGNYRLEARVDNNEGVYAAFKQEDFIIDKIEVKLPERDTTEYIYNHEFQTYKIVDLDLDNAKLYDVGTVRFQNAGTHKIQLIIKDFEFYRWPNYEEIYELDFIIKKKPIEKPTADRSYKYNGNPITYKIAQNEEYLVSNNTTQTEVGRYTITVGLKDKVNTMWSDLSVDDLEFEFVINQNQILNTTITDSNGGVIEKKEVSVISVSGVGLSPEVDLYAEIFSEKDKEELKTIKAHLGDNMKKYDKIFKVTDISLILNDEKIQPENNITLKLLVPEKLVNANFRLYHIHIDENGREVVSEIDHSGVDEDGYIVFQTDKLSSFVFVYEQSSLVGLIITFACLMTIMLALLIVQLIWFIKNRKISKKILASAVPVFYVGAELASTITLGILAGLLLVANVVLLVLNLNLRKTIACKQKQEQEKSQKEKVKGKAKNKK